MDLPMPEGIAAEIQIGSIVQQADESVLRLWPAVTWPDTGIKKPRLEKQGDTNQNTLTIKPYPFNIITTNRGFGTKWNLKIFSVQIF